jgi:hypothetical protein
VAGGAEVTVVDRLSAMDVAVGAGGAGEGSGGAAQAVVSGGAVFKHGLEILDVTEELDAGRQGVLEDGLIELTRRVEDGVVDQDPRGGVAVAEAQRARLGDHVRRALEARRGRHASERGVDLQVPDRHDGLPAHLQRRGHDKVDVPTLADARGREVIPVVEPVEPAAVSVYETPGVPSGVPRLGVVSDPELEAHKRARTGGVLAAAEPLTEADTADGARVLEVHLNPGVASDHRGDDAGPPVEREIDRRVRGVPVTGAGQDTADSRGVQRIDEEGALTPEVRLGLDARTDAVDAVNEEMGHRLTVEEARRADARASYQSLIGVTVALQQPAGGTSAERRTSQAARGQIEEGV